MQISERLMTVAGMVSPDCRLADVGTDHAYIPIYLIQNGTVSKAIAMDINQGPLLRATENIRHYGLAGRIETRLSDGLEKLQEGEADTILIAGMGGLLMIRILENGRAVLKGCRELVLQPQSDIRSVREYLEKKGWQIDREDLVFEDGKYYPMMRARRIKSPANCGAHAAEGLKDPKKAEAFHELELRYGPLLLKQHHPLLPDYLNRKERLCRQVLEAIQGKETETAKMRRAELQKEMGLLDRAKKLVALAGTDE